MLFNSKNYDVCTERGRLMYMKDKQAMILNANGVEPDSPIRRYVETKYRVMEERLLREEAAARDKEIEDLEDDARSNYTISFDWKGGSK